jgi:DNA polymerase family A
MTSALPASFESFEQIWLVDFEFCHDCNLNPAPVCLVALELRSGVCQRLWQDEFGPAPPYPLSANSLFVAYYASAEIGCHLALGWPAPQRVLDVFPEFKCLVNGSSVPAGGYGLLGALAFFGLDSMAAAEKRDMRELVLSGGPWSEAQKAAILDYCEDDVHALARLLPVMGPHIDLPRALLRGRYMAAAARVEFNGVPLDRDTLHRLMRHWDQIKQRLIECIDADYGVYEGSTFKAERFAGWLARRGLPWPLHESGRLDLSDDAFREMARANPEVAPLHELRTTLAKLRLNDLQVGSDGHNRTLLSAFKSKTGRNQPSNSRFIFGPSTWLRGLIQPPPGHGLAYIDWQQQEFGIAAALSGDGLMMQAYQSGDPYLTFAKQAKAVPAGASKASHKPERDLFKACVLAVQYGMGEASLAQRIGKPPVVARQLLKLHRDTYKVFWRWSDAMLDDAMLSGTLQTVFGWRLSVGPNPNPRSLRNFHMQANGAEMLRLACCKATEEGICLAAPVHDAVLITAPLEHLDAHIARMQEIMAEASRIVLDGFELGTDVAQVRYPNRYTDERGRVMWDTVMALLAECEDGDG